MAHGPLPPPPPQRAPDGAAPQSGSRCFTCNEIGHYARDCPKKRRTGGAFPVLCFLEAKGTGVEQAPAQASWATMPTSMQAAQQSLVGSLRVIRGHAPPSSACYKRPNCSPSCFGLEASIGKSKCLLPVL